MWVPMGMISLIAGLGVMAGSFCSNKAAILGQTWG
jgi:hypothetical protein